MNFRKNDNTLKDECRLKIFGNAIIIVVKSKKYKNYHFDIRDLIYIHCS